MSHQLINHSPDLKKLRDEGYEISIESGYLVMHNIPYVNSKGKVQKGKLVSELTTSGDKTAKPSQHIAHFVGEQPCDKNSSPLNIVHQAKENRLTDNLVTQFSFSMKPLSNGTKRDYIDYDEKMTTYEEILSAPAKSKNPDVTAKTFAPIPLNEEDSVFNYLDTASSRAEIIAVTKKLELHKLAIIGLGGTGSYILDLVAKTPVKEIHLFDSDIYLSHNAFRSPGAPTLEQLREQPKKVDYFKSIYEKMHKGIKAHDYDIDRNNIDELTDMDFVFISIHGGNEKKSIFEKLEEFGVPFIDVGMGLYLEEESCSLGGMLRITTSTDYKREHVESKVSFSGEGDGNDDYAKNIQIADLNALNALLAVIKWKKLCGFYLDFEKEHSSIYTIDGNIINNDDKP